MNRNSVVFLGPQGSGKGTQSRLLAAKLHWVRVEAGELVRTFAAGESAEARQAAADLTAGRLVPDRLICQLFDIELTKLTIRPGIIFDGFFRRLTELSHEQTSLERAGFAVYGLVLQIDDAEAKKRLALRARADDKRVTIEERLALYHSETSMVIKELSLQGRAVFVDGAGPVETVAHRIWQAVSPLL